MLNACRGWRTCTTDVIDGMSSGRAFENPTGQVNKSRSRDKNRLPAVACFGVGRLVVVEMEALSPPPLALAALLGDQRRVESPNRSSRIRLPQRVAYTARISARFLIDAVSAGDVL